MIVLDYFNDYLIKSQYLNLKKSESPNQERLLFESIKYFKGGIKDLQKYAHSPTSYLSG